MPKWGHILQIYVKDEKEKEEMKKLAKKLGVSISAIIRAFFRSLAAGSANIIINRADNQVIIGEINVNLTQHNNVQINNNIIALVFSRLSEWEEMTKKALYSKSSLQMRNALAYLNQAFKQMREDLKIIGVK